jgi:hypothetical protein
MQGDWIVSSLLLDGADPWNSPRRIGVDAPPAALTGEQLTEYARLLVESVNRVGVDAVILCDDLPGSVLRWMDNSRCWPVRAMACNSRNNYERRWFAAREFLSKRLDIKRVFFADINDVLLLSDPFAWWDRFHPGTPMIVAREPYIYATSEWMKEHLAPLPREVWDYLMVKHGQDKIATCGAWGGTADSVRGILRDMTALIEVFNEWLTISKHPSPVMTDMAAFGMSLFAGAKTPTFCSFRQDDTTGPLIHNRKMAEQWLSSQKTIPASD